MDLTVRDGFNFGCGFFIAAAVYSVAVTIFFFVMFAIFGAVGTGVLGGLLR